MASLRPAHSLGTRLGAWAASTVVAGSVVLAASVLPRSGGAAEQSQPADRTAQLQELAERLLVPPFQSPDGQPQTVRLLPGQLPSDLPLELPLPTASRLVGSAVRSSSDRAVSTDVILDVLAEEPDVVSFYEQALAGSGWTAPPLGGGPPRGGFQAASPARTIYFCRSAGGPWLSLLVLSRPPGPNELRLHTETANPGPCANLAGPAARGPGAPGADLVPSLRPPSGVSLGSTNTGGGPNNRWTSEATTTTDLSVAALEAHFSQQLEAAGWRRLAGQADAPLAWSTWAVPGPTAVFPAGTSEEADWHGFLFALEGPGEQRRALYVRVEPPLIAVPAPPTPARPPVVPPSPPQPPAPVPTSTSTVPTVVPGPRPPTASTPAVPAATAP